jgi:hypothetical protein
MKLAIPSTLMALALVATASCGDSQDAAVGLSSGSATAALLSSEQDLEDFPPWIWPVIYPVDIFANVFAGRVQDEEFASSLMKQAAAKLCDCTTDGKYSFDQLLAIVDASLDAQVSTVRFAQLKAAGFGGGSLGSYDDDDWCGTGPKPPFPWPFPHRLFTLELDTIRGELSQVYHLDSKQLATLSEHLGAQLKRFEALAQ